MDKYELALISVTLFAILLQLYVIWLIQRASPKGMEHYRYFLNMTAFWDLSFTLLYGIILQPIPFPPLFIVGIRGLAYYFGNWGATLAFCGMYYAGTNLLLSQTYSLLYRYVLLHDNPELYRSFMSLKSKVFYIVLFQAISLFLGYFTSLTLKTPEQVFSLVANLPPRFLANANPGEHIIWLDMKWTVSRCFFALTIVGFFVDLVLCVYLIWQILSVLKTGAKRFSRNTYRLHFQLLTPFFCIVAPTVACIVLIFTGTPNTEFTAKLGMFLLVLYAPSNAIFTVLFVTPYRQHITRKFAWFLRIMGFEVKEQNVSVTATALSGGMYYSNVQ